MFTEDNDMENNYISLLYLITGCFIGLAAVSAGMLMAHLTRKTRDRTPWESYEQYHRRKEDQNEPEEEEEDNDR
jgi:hypothetical protein